MRKLALLYLTIIMLVLLLACTPANAITSSNTPTTSSTVAIVPDKVEILYFHRTAR
jgi:hypothetical protein